MKDAFQLPLKSMFRSVSDSEIDEELDEGYTAVNRVKEMEVNQSLLVINKGSVKNDTHSDLPTGTIKRKKTTNSKSVTITPIVPDLPGLKETTYSTSKNIKLFNDEKGSNATCKHLTFRVNESNIYFQRILIKQLF